MTLGTLNYLRRLLVKPGEIVSSPFRNNDAVNESLVIDPSEHAQGGGLYEYACSPDLLEQIVADPRQRLARLFKQSSPAHGFPEINYAPSKDDYQPIDYMDYADESGVDNETSRAFIEERSVGEKKLNLINSAHETGELYGRKGRFSSNPGIMEHKNDSFDKFPVEELSQENNSDGHILRPNNGKVEHEESLGKRPFEHMLDANLKENDLQDEVGEPIPNQSPRSDQTPPCQHKDYSPEWFVSHSGDKHDKAGINENMTDGDLLLEDYTATREPTGDHRRDMPSLNESEETPSQTCGLDFEICDRMVPSYEESDYVASLDESSTSTLGSTCMTGDGCNTTFASSTLVVNSDKEMLENGSMPHIETDEWHLDHRKASENTVEAPSELTNEAGVLKNEALNCHVSENKKHEEDLQRLQCQLDQVLEAKGHVEKIAEEAISSQADLKKKVLGCRNELSQALDDVDLLRKERIFFLNEQEKFRERFEVLRHSLEISENTKRLDESQRYNLNLAMEEMKGEQDSLKVKLRNNEKIIGDFTDEKQRTDRDLEDLRKEKLELMVVLEGKDQELRGLMNQTEAMRSSLEVVEKEKSKIKELYSHEGKEIIMLKKHLENLTTECAQLSAALIDRDTALRKVQDNSRLLEISREELLSRIEELEQERERLCQDRILENQESYTEREILMQMKLSVQELKEERDRYEQMYRDSQTMISALKHELGSEKAIQGFADREREEASIEFRRLEKSTAVLQTEKANLESYNLQLLESLEKSKTEEQGEIVSLQNENQELQMRLRNCTTNFLNSENEKKAIANQLENVSKKRGDLSRESLLRNGFCDRTDRKLVLAEDKEKMNAVFVRFRSRAKRELHKVRVHHEKVVQDSEGLHSKFVGLGEQVVLLEQENAKLRYHRKKCLDGLRNGRDKIAKSVATTAVLRRQNQAPGSNALTLVTELYLTKSSMDIPGGRM
ncbi:unnamed protein product [Cylindrotheca closterium]|uniref:Uncharacterized protein n=1 Tax=Cylindrotheca closterium TaxID=2856 RepID=A0AAD2JIJ2_9STRA|nr:unnamed protein product [Cylindrotheca closterium]